MPGLLGKNCAAGDHHPGIAGGLACKIIAPGMDDDGAADEVSYTESLVIKC